MRECKYACVRVVALEEENEKVLLAFFLLFSLNHDNIMSQSLMIVPVVENRQEALNLIKSINN